MGNEMITDRLFSLRDPEYGAFQASLIPTVSPDRVIGVRTPVLKKLAKELAGTEEAAAFMSALPHCYYDENQLHAFLLSGIKDLSECMSMTESFLPYIDNWATCDQLSPPVFGKNKDVLLERIPVWLASDLVYTVRFGLDMLMRHFLDDAFDPSQPELILPVIGDEYYINMAAAWYFATALVKQYDEIIPFLSENRIPVWTHNKAIQKALESRRISEERKEYLKTLRRKNEK